MPNVNVFCLLPYFFSCISIILHIYTQNTERVVRWAYIALTSFRRSDKLHGSNMDTQMVGYFELLENQINKTLLGV